MCNFVACKKLTKTKIQKKIVVERPLQVSGCAENCHKNFGCLNGKSRQKCRQHCRCLRPFTFSHFFSISTGRKYFKKCTKK